MEKETRIEVQGVFVENVLCRLVSIVFAHLDVLVMISGKKCYLMFGEKMWSVLWLTKPTALWIGELLPLSKFVLSKSKAFAAPCLLLVLNM